MHDHRLDKDPTVKVDITSLVREHATKHPGTVNRSLNAKARASAKKAKASRKRNRS